MLHITSSDFASMVITVALFILIAIIAYLIYRCKRRRKLYHNIWRADDVVAGRPVRREFIYKGATRLGPYTPAFMVNIGGDTRAPPPRPLVSNQPSLPTPPPTYEEI